MAYFLFVGSDLRNIGNFPSEAGSGIGRYGSTTHRRQVCSSLCAKILVAPRSLLRHPYSDVDRRRGALLRHPEIVLVVIVVLYSIGVVPTGCNPPSAAAS